MPETTPAEGHFQLSSAFLFHSLFLFKLINTTVQLNQIIWIETKPVPLASIASLVSVFKVLETF